MYRPRHAKKESILSILFTLFMLICISWIVIVSVFGSWEKFIIEVIDVIPWGEFLFKAVAQLMNAGMEFVDNTQNGLAGNVVEDCLKLLVASVLLPVARFFTGADKPAGKHAAPLTISNRIFYFAVDKIFTPLVVAIVAVWLIEYISGLIWSLNDIWAWILSIAGTVATLGISTWAFYMLAAKTVWWGIAYMIAKIIPAALSTIFSYELMFAILILISSPEYISAIGPIAILFLGIIIMLSAVTTKTDDFFLG